MDKIKVSNRINRLGCGDELLYCTRVYVNARTYGGAWIPMEWFLNNLFFLIRREKEHVRSAYLWERRNPMNKCKWCDSPSGNADFCCPYHKISYREAQKQLEHPEVSAEFEFDFQPREKHDEVSECKECGELVTEAEAVIVKKFYGGFSSEITFCTETCATEFYIKRLREVDGR